MNSKSLLKRLSLRVISLALLVLALVPATPTQAQRNFVVNGNFDTEVPANGTDGFWTSTGSDSAGGTFNLNGNNVFVINAAGEAETDPSISQELTGLTPGSPIRLAATFRSTTAVAAIRTSCHSVLR